MTKAQQDISNYPLKCFCSSCDRRLHAEQLKRLVKSQDELDRYYQISVLARAREILETGLLSQLVAIHTELIVGHGSILVSSVISNYQIAKGEIAAIFCFLEDKGLEWVR